MATISGLIWEIDLSPMIGRDVQIETVDGIRRAGRISSVGFRELRFNDGIVNIPVHVELNGDPLDQIPFTHMGSIEILG